MRVGNWSLVTPSRFFTKMTVDELQQYRTAALLRGELYTDNTGEQGFTVTLPTWYGKKREKSGSFFIGKHRVVFIYCGENDFSRKPGKEALWIVRILS